MESARRGGPVSALELNGFRGGWGSSMGVVGNGGMSLLLCSGGRRNVVLSVGALAEGVAVTAEGLGGGIVLPGRCWGVGLVSISSLCRWCLRFGRSIGVKGLVQWGVGLVKRVGLCFCWVGAGIPAE